MMDTTGNMQHQQQQPSSGPAPLTSSDSWGGAATSKHQLKSWKQGYFFQPSSQDVIFLQEHF